MRGLILNVALRREIKMHLVRWYRVLVKSQKERYPFRFGISDLAVDVLPFIRQIRNHKPAVVNLLKYSSWDFVTGTPLLVNSDRSQRRVWMRFVEAVYRFFECLLNAIQYLALAKMTWQ